MTTPKHPGPPSHAERTYQAVLRAAAEANQLLTPEFLDKLKLHAQQLADELKREARRRRDAAYEARKRA